MFVDEVQSVIFARFMWYICMKIIVEIATSERIDIDKIIISNLSQLLNNFRFLLYFNIDQIFIMLL